MVRRNVTIDRTERENVQSNLRRLIKRVLWNETEQRHPLSTSLSLPTSLGATKPANNFLLCILGIVLIMVPFCSHNIGYDSSVSVSQSWNCHIRWRQEERPFGVSD
jgi:hypothetical protein